MKEKLTFQVKEIENLLKDENLRTKDLQEKNKLQSS